MSQMRHAHFRANIAPFFFLLSAKAWFQCLTQLPSQVRLCCCHSEAKRNDVVQKPEDLVLK